MAESRYNLGQAGWPGDFDISKPPIVLTTAQDRIVNDKKLVEACGTFNMASLLTQTRDRERDKELRRRADVANRAAFCFGLLRLAYREPGLVSNELRERLADALQQQLLRETQLVARQRVCVAMDQEYRHTSPRS